MDSISIMITIISIVVTVVGIFATPLYSSLKKYKDIKKWKKNETKNKIRVLGGPNTFKLIRSSNFIQPQKQPDGPHNNEEFIASENAREPFIEELVKYIYDNKDDVVKKRYALLAGSGMGKTTISAYFVDSYINYKKRQMPPYPIYAFYLGDSESINHIKQIKEDDSVLVLDALDENVEAANDLPGFMEKLYDVTDRFSYVIYTSRTQFFPDKEHEPAESTKEQNDTNKEPLSVDRIYISPFSTDETKTYLGKKYGKNSTKYDKAIKIIEKSKKLIVRPMVLKFVDSLIDVDNVEELTNFEVYKRIIDEWFLRECRNSKKSSVKVSDLYSFSKKIALYIYNNWESSGKMYISNEEYELFIKKYNLDEKLFMRSLLNRNNDGYKKFTHKSFWEFFLSIISIERPGFTLNPKAFDMAKVFAKEIYDLSLKGEISKFDCIDFPKPVFLNEITLINPSLDNIILDLNGLQSSNKKKNVVKNTNRILYNLWEILIQSKVYEVLPSNIYSLKAAVEEKNGVNTLDFETIVEQMNNSKDGQLPDNIRNMFDPNRRELLTALETLGILKDSDSFQKIANIVLSDIHRFFCASDSNLQQSAIANIIANLNLLNKDFDFSKRDLKEFYFDFGKKEEWLVFPNVLESDLFYIEKRLIDNIICLGNGINDDTDIISTIDSILEKKHKARKNLVICIYREVKILDEAVSFIKQIATSIDINSRNVIIYLTYKEKNIHYIINQDTKDCTPQQLSNCINSLCAIPK